MVDVFVNKSLETLKEFVEKHKGDFSTDGVTKLIKLLIDRHVCSKIIQISKVYRSITLQKVSQLLGSHFLNDVSATESFLLRLAHQNIIHITINHQDGTILFNQPNESFATPSDTLRLNRLIDHSMLLASQLADLKSLALSSSSSSASSSSSSLSPASSSDIPSFSFARSTVCSLFAFSHSRCKRKEQHRNNDNKRQLF